MEDIRSMIDNKNFNDAFERSDMTMYALSRRSGVPYTTINEIRNGRNDINQCAAGTVWKLAAALGVDLTALMNPINYLDGVKGKYKGIDFTWSVGDTTFITFEYDGESVTLDTGAVFNIPARFEYYRIIAGWMIKEHIDSREWQKTMHNRVSGRVRT